MIYCFDLNGTTDTYPEQLGPMMSGLKAQGHTIVILTGAGNEPTPTQERIDMVAAELAKRDLCYDQIVLVGSGPEGTINDDEVARNKVAWMKHAGASVMVDDKKANVRAAQKAGFMTMRVK